GIQVSSGTAVSALDCPAITGGSVGVGVDGGKALLERNNLAGNGAAGIRVLNDAIVDAGDCLGSNVTGLGSGTGANGSSAGGNQLSGYGFDNAAPWAIENINANVQHSVLAQDD